MNDVEKLDLIIRMRLKGVSDEKIEKLLKTLSSFPFTEFNKGNEMGKLQVTINMEAEIVSEYVGIDGERMFVIQVVMHLENPSPQLNDMMFLQFMSNMTRSTIDEDGVSKDIYVDVISEENLIQSNRMFYGGMIPIPQDVQDAWDNR